MNKELQKIIDSEAGIYILPFGEVSDELPEGYKYQVQRRALTPEDYYIKENEDGEQEFFLKKQFIYNLGSDAGVIFRNDAIKGEFLTADRMVYQANVQVTILKPDGTEKMNTSSQVADVDVEAEMYADQLSERLKEGIVSNKKTEKVILSHPGGQWKQIGKERRYFLKEEQRIEFVEKNKKKYILKLRANISAIAQTKAKIKAIKEIANIKNAYPITELNKPFIVIRSIREMPVSITPDQVTQTQDKIDKMFA